MIPSRFKDKRDVLILLGLFVGALLLRLYRLSPVFSVRDEIILPSYVLDSIPQQWSIQSFLTIDHVAIGNPLRLFAYVLGAFQPTIIFFALLFYNLAGIPITEFTWVLPVIFLGAATVFPVYLLTKKLSDRKAGLLAALLLAVLPIHVMESRSLAAAWILAFLLETLFLYLFISYLEGRKQFLIPASIVFGLYILSHNQFPSLIPVIFYTAFVYQDRRESFLQRGLETLKTLKNWRLWLFPGLSFSGLLSLHIIFTYFIKPQFRRVKTDVGALSHMLDRGLSWGFYIESVLHKWFNNVGHPLFFISLLAIILSFVYLRRWNKKGILLVWGVSYILPFIFAVRFSIVRGYMSDAIFAFTILTVVVITDIVRRYFSTDRLAIFCVALLALFTIPYTVSSAYQIDTGNFFSLPSFHGSFEPNAGLKSFETNTGLKAASYWVRKKTEATATVLTIGIDPVLARFYSGRKIYGIIDGTVKEGLDYLVEVQKEIDYLIVEGNSETEVKHIPGFNRSVTILNNGIPSVYIYSKKEGISHTTVEISNYNTSFNREYSELKDFLGAKDYVISKTRGIWKTNDFPQK